MHNLEFSIIIMGFQLKNFFISCRQIQYPGNLFFNVIKYLTTEVIIYESVVFKFMEALKVIIHFG